MQINFNDIMEMDKRFRANLINSVWGVRTIHLLGTRSKENIPNLSLVNSVFHLGANPPLMGFVMRPLTVRRDSWNNLLENPFFSLNSVQESFLNKAHQCSAKYDAEVSEFEASGLTETHDNDLPVTYVKESAVKISLEMRENFEVKSNNTIIITGEVKKLFIDDDYIDEEGNFQAEKAGISGVAGLNEYYNFRKVKNLPYARP
ncbi:MAG: flavin oxidoreductase [Chitinophagaceae bacterium]|nr:MAG: flavin oxidoreductase [Chitinophagaceae bacterium]